MPMKMDQRQLLLCFVLLVVGSVTVTADTCPGGYEKCPDFMTCCSLSNDEFGCCPFPNAKCCPDGIHCCPYNMECDSAHEACVRNGSPVQFYWRVPIHPEIVEPVVSERTSRHQNSEVSDLQQFRKENSCPDASKCHSTFTCCKMYSGKYGCCPFDDGTCCQAGFHCCPHGSKCSANGECFSTEMNYTVNAYPLKDEKYEKLMKTKEELEKAAYENDSVPWKKCPDGRPCPESYTCCRIDGKRYGCCPYTDARCCDDGIRCCPKGTNCNITLATCDVQENFGWSVPSQTLINLQWSEAPESVEVSNHIEEEITKDVICPDERYHCPSGSTCCGLSSGAFGCCPFERGICCSDQEYCCPFGYECFKDKCIEGTHHLPLFLRTVAAVKDHQKIQVESEKIEELSSVICPDLNPCPNHNTCCQLESGEYGCCPMDEATCCPDKMHCCPNGYHCLTNVCEKNSGSSWSVPQFLSAIAISSESELTTVEVHREAQGEDPWIVCPDGEACPAGTTCCEIASGYYGCCPLGEQATCCADKVHCCPQGFYCAEDYCDTVPEMPHHLAPFLRKLSIIKKIIGN